MTIQLNNISKTGIITSLSEATIFASSSTLKIYPSSVSFPSVPVNNATGFPTTNILSYGSLTYSLTGNTISITAGTTSANASAAGTLLWWALVPSSPSIGCIVSDSIGLSGSGSVLIVNTMTPSNGQSVTITLNLTLS